jgi:hypothetical protein
MKLKHFIGRKEELERLSTLYRKEVPSLVVVNGRRRIGKSRLIKEFASKVAERKFWSFAGLAPEEGTTAQTQRDYFARQLAGYLKVPPLTFLDWSDALEHLSLHVRKGDIILFDEISWMGDEDPTFVPKLKAWWDKQTIHIIVVFCGSISTWIEENILNSTAFFGRINLTITLGPLSIPESAELLKVSGFKGSSYDIYKLLSILGGVPWYLEQATSGTTADNIIKQLCFVPKGLLVLEFDSIFHDLFKKRGMVYKKIISSLKDGMRTLSEIRKAIGFARSGTLSELVEHLIIAGFIKKQDLWSFKTTKSLKQSLYRICDPYMRFYLKVIELNRNRIDIGAFNDVSVSKIPGFEAHIGIQLEYLLQQNRALLLKAAGIFAEDIVCEGPYRQPKTAGGPGCQIDYLIQTSTRNLFVFEFKFKRQELGVEIVAKMKNKIKALKVPRGYAAVPILCHISGVASSVETGGYFYRVIDITDFL